MVDMRMLAVRPVLFTNLTALVAGFAMFGTFVLVPNFVQTPHGLPSSIQRMVDYGFDASATKAGLYLLPSSITLLFAGPIAGLIGRRIGSKWPLAAGLAARRSGSGRRSPHGTTSRGRSWPRCRCSASASASPSRRWRR